MSVRTNKILALALLTTVTFAAATPALAQTVINEPDSYTIVVDSDQLGAGDFFVVDGNGSATDVTTINSSAQSTTLQTANGHFLSVTETGTNVGGGTFNTQDDTNLGNGVTDTTTITGVANVNASVNANTNINTGTSTGTVAIGNSASTTNVLGTTNINATGAAATNVGTGTGAVTVGNTTGAAAVNGSTVTSTAATTNTMASGDNTVVIDNTANTVTLTADSDATAGNGRSVITAGPTSASMLVTTATGVSHGVNVTQTATTISGGTASTTLTLNDDGATFANTTTGGAARVMGVADGVNDTDAVNMRQFNSLRSDMDEAEGGIANVAAMANIPQVEPGKSFSVGAGYGNFKGENAMALGGSARFTDNVVAKASVGFGSENATTVGGGVSYSW